MLTTSVLVLATLAPTAPVPADPVPNPTGKAFLGVMSQDEFSLVVGSVVPNMPAGRAGIAPGDRLLRVGSFEPIDFQQLRARVQTYRPGATIEIEVDRRGSRRTFQVRLAATPDTPVVSQLYPLLPFDPNN